MLNGYKDAIEYYKPYMVDFDDELKKYHDTVERLVAQLKTPDKDGLIMPDEIVSKELNIFIKKFVKGINHYADWSDVEPKPTTKSYLLGLLIYGWIFHGEYSKESKCTGWWVKSKYSDVHQLLYLWLLDDKRKSALAFPRKIGKTTSEKVFISWCATTMYEPYLVWVGDTDDNITLHLTNIKEMMTSNIFLNEVFGQLKVTESVWRENEIKITTGFHLIAKSKRSPFRGLLDDSPPTYIIVDDMDNDEEKGSLMLRDKLDDKLDTALYPAVLPDGRVRHIGTILYDDCILDRRLKNSSWHAIILSCWRDDNVPLEERESIVPEILSTKLLLEIREEYFNSKPVPKPHVWYSEHENKPVNESTRKFKSSNLKRWEGYYKDGYLHMQDGRRIKVRTTCAVDLASSYGGLKSDSTVVTTCATDQEYNLYVLRVWKKHSSKPSDTVEEIINQYYAFNISEAHVEAIGLQDLILETWDKRTKSMPIFPQLHQIRHRKQTKDDRLRGAIITKLDNGKIFLKQGDKDQESIIEEMDSYMGSGAHDDVLDTLADNIVYAVAPSEQETQKDEYAHRPLALRPNKRVESVCDDWIN
jgi:hypothetical protein